ncbi:N-acetylmuramoyl-L-alanine amidase [Geoalkalibacter halelectricus]|uniref:N-acetylmuramoyl-L-alanine amidase n=1 Tax=Geoalkalibacter halelectricus TaxID=2847045 RepID=A0ABY5ZQT2_9BACT|nr:N-acetylmuramoyl-L-alanine amidase [Geoalkalibacter halelectricus]MDO3379285.1 N-acetylmuramoyl-L-alanine amidase [Geoalkalibacter halelectricus]UWZ81041.1 N-acetylmuramoyl-L-alanine amidase [Geoalkalibacter halelectricus]
MTRWWLIPLLFFILQAPASAAVEIAAEGAPPVRVAEVYWQEGTYFIAIDDILAALNIRGRWNSVQHTYSFPTPRGTAVISPGSHFVKVGGRFLPLSQRPRFLDNRLRVPEDFITQQLPNLLNTGVYYRNLAPRAPVPVDEDTTLDRLFALLMQDQGPRDVGRLRAVALDPGHGGQDTGSISADGTREKDVALDVARHLERILKMRLGIPVYLSREADYALTPQQRLEPAARAEVDALISLHAQASLRPEPQGIALVVRPREEYEGMSLEAAQGGSMKLAQHLGRSLERAGFQVSGIYQAPLLPLGRGNLPTVLVEMGYLSNPEDRARLTDPAGQEALAQALFAGLQNFADERRERSR